MFRLFDILFTGKNQSTNFSSKNLKVFCVPFWSSPSNLLLYRYSGKRFQKCKWEILNVSKIPEGLFVPLQQVTQLQINTDASICQETLTCRLRVYHSGTGRVGRVGGVGRAIFGFDLFCLHFKDFLFGVGDVSICFTQQSVNKCY